MLPENHTESQVEELFTNPEPWEKWETKLVWGSIIIATLSLLILGIVINLMFL
jgi:cytochrome b561